jgi:hypothetical protein
MKLMTFVLGAAAGFAAYHFQREIMKGAIVLGSKFRELQEEVASDLEDHMAEAKSELRERNLDQGRRSA